MKKFEKLTQLVKKGQITHTSIELSLKAILEAIDIPHIQTLAVPIGVDIDIKRLRELRDRYNIDMNEFLTDCCNITPFIM